MPSPKPASLTLWTLQTPDIQKRLARGKSHVCDPALSWHGRNPKDPVDLMFRRAYLWMAKEMRKRGIKGKPQTFPVWAWEGRRPDLRRERHALPLGEKGVLMRLEVDPRRVLISDFSLWHSVLNRWLLSWSEREDTLFEKWCLAHDAKAKLLPKNRQRAFWDDLSRTGQRKIEASWQGIFDFRRVSPWCRPSLSDSWRQASLWTIEPEDVKETLFYEGARRERPR